MIFNDSVSGFRDTVYRGREWLIRIECRNKKLLETATSSCFMSSFGQEMASSLMIDLMYGGISKKALILAEEGAIMSVRGADSVMMALRILDGREITPYLNYLKKHFQKDDFMLKEFKQALKDGDTAAASRFTQVICHPFRRELERIVAIGNGAKRNPWPQTCKYLCLSGFCFFGLFVIFLWKPLKRLIGTIIRTYRTNKLHNGKRFLILKQSDSSKH